jgi:UDP-N-acetylmuramate dehydrogenase
MNKIQENISLLPYNSFRMNVSARYLAELKNDREIVDFISSYPLNDTPWMVLGGGSNVLFTRDFNGLIIRPAMNEIEIIEQKGDSVWVKAGAGTDWDHLVEWTVGNGFGGMENLSKIPGTAGACPVQNIGAYGREVKDVIEEVKTVDIETGKVTTFHKEACEFGYRSSIFKYRLKNKLIITSVTFLLLKNADPFIGYGELAREMEKYEDKSIANVRKAVSDIRGRKLPDPAIIGNAGSFFKNPVVSAAKAAELLSTFPLMPAYPADVTLQAAESAQMQKLSAAWLIDQCGWKGKRTGDTGIYEKHSLILVNYGHATGTEILQLATAIRESVVKKFGIDLEPEVNII